MSEIKDPAKLEILMSSVHQYNEMIDLRQQAMLEANAFKLPNGATEADFKAVSWQQEQLKAELPERRTMLDKFAFFLDERFTYLNSLDLGETTRPGSHDELLALKNEYRVLLGILVDEGVTKGEIPRDEAQRSVSFQDFNGESHDYALGNRIRKLFEFNGPAGQPMCVAKMMIFLTPRANYKNGHVSMRNQLEAIERRIDQRDESIIPVRTIYFGKRDD